MSKDGWPLTREFAEGLSRVSMAVTTSMYAINEAAQRAMLAFIKTQEVMVVTQAKVHFMDERGWRPTFWDLHRWAKETGRGQLADFLYASRRDPTITGLFGTEPPDEPLDRP